ncbi:matrilin-2 isoform X1 [Terrapene carolina triunguis]|uniref:matrilin-2 isoform X1 n=1 Tax=Terrapene triunguis TaxID=2587831 RepID=UPI000E77BFBF|nr:matrilin-2 isoform X1 [Terrapene carolina triunguis]XP_029770235.1 matrilin-2 isoform X1 [Terrapene carolina triunguis]
MKKMITCFLLLFGQTLLFSASARERHLPPAFSSQRNGANPEDTLLENACNRKRLDLVFIIDSSRSVRPYDFEKVKEFILTILQFLDISPDVTRVGLIQYGSTVKHEFSLKTFRRKHDVERAVKRMMHLATGTMTGLAIQYALNIAFSESEGARPLSQNVPRIIMIVTDGRPQDPVAEVAAKARNSGILIFAIGVGRVDMNTLKSIGSEPHEEHVFLVANFSQIETLTSAFQTKLCVPHVCSITEHGCDHFCINTPGSYMCRCKQGYILNADQKTCSTQDLCAVEKHACEQICVNTPGSYVCQCYDGYGLDEDGKKCIVVDLCALDNQGCQHECVSMDDSYYCRCHQGFILNPDRRTCRRPDYCALQTHGCQQECVNTNDSYFCQCRHGFTLNPDKRTCKRINFCALGKHGCEQECVNTEDSFVCRCHSGYTLNRDGKTCRRVDHCAENNHGCEQLCLNTGDSYVCQCSEGFIINEDLKTCTRVDYCALSDPGCEHLCVNSEKSYTCQCFEGYELRDDGKTCKHKDLCKSIDHGCEQVCVNDDISYTCQCHEGFILRKDGKTCRSKDACKSVDPGCEHICVNTDSSYICKCHEGFVLREDGKTCRNKDLCKTVDHGCEHICINNDHSYVCKCHEGFVLQEDGKMCRRCTEGPIDLVFVIDGSKSLGEDNFEVVKEFVSGILDSLEISPKAARAGLLQYSSQVRTEFTLRQFSTAKDMKKAVSQMKYMGKGSMTGLALKQMFERSFTEAEGARPFSAEVPRVSIVFTDGRAQDEVSEWASKAKQNGITIYAVGIGKAIEEELLEIASEPPDKHLFYAEDFSTMGEISEKLKKRICEALEESDPHQDPLTGRPHKTGPHSSGSEPVSIAVTDLLACSNFAVHHKYLLEEESVSQSTARSANPSKDKEQCNCENLMTFQNHANAEVKKLTQRLEEITKRMEALENRLRY